MIFKEISNGNYMLIDIEYINPDELIYISKNKRIRKGCFETNSSSMHSIVITKNDTHVTPEEFCPTEDNNESIYLCKGKLLIRGDISSGYGRRPFKLLTTFEEKFKYALCEYLGDKYCDDDDYDETWNMFVDLAKEIIPGCDGIDIYMQEMDIYLDEDGNPIKKINLYYDYEKDGYTYKDKDGNIHDATLDDENIYEYPEIGCIDHQSAGLLMNFLKKKNISLKEFLTNKRYIIVCDGDEYYTWNRYKNSGMIDKSIIVEEFDTSNEDVEYLEWLKEQRENEKSNKENSMGN